QRETWRGLRKRPASPSPANLTRPPPTPLVQSRQFLRELSRRQPAYPELLARIGRGRDQFDLAHFDGEKLGKDSRHGRVGLATLRRGGRLNLNPLAIPSRYPIA